jgi:ATP-dependent Clp protease ATP-binding subunit ClpB
MDASSMTTRSQEAFAAALRSAAASGNPQIDPLHLLVALLSQQDGTAPALLKALGADPGEVSAQVRSAVAALPTAAGSGVQSPPPARALHEVLQRAADLAGELGDEYISTEHLMVGVATVAGPAQQLLTGAGATPDALRDAFATVRGNARVTTQDPEATYQSLEKYGVDLTELARQGQLDPVIGRDAEIRRVVQVLSRRTKNNPVLIGEPGVERPPSWRDSLSASSPATSRSHCEAAG